MQGPPHRGWGPLNASYGQTVLREVLQEHNASTLAQLRDVKDAASIQWPAKYMNDLDVAPYFSGYFPDDLVVPGPSVEARFAAGAINPAQLLVGHNSKDGTAGFYGNAPTLGLLPGDKVQTKPEDYERLMRAEWGQHADAVLAQYPLHKSVRGPPSP